MSLLKQLVARFGRLRLRSAKSFTVTNVTPKLCLLPAPAFQLTVCVPATLVDLPSELIILILDLAGPETIVSATAVSRRFREIVASSSGLQYRVALVLAGMHDRGDHAPSGDRLRALNARTAAWRSFQYRDRLTLDIGAGALRPVSQRTRPQRVCLSLSDPHSFKVLRPPQWHFLRWAPHWSQSAHPHPHMATLAITRQSCRWPLAVRLARH